MALQGWDKNYREELKIQQEVIESLQQQLTIGRRERPAENPPPGGNPGRPPWPGYPNPMPPGKDWPSAGLQINPEENDDDYGEGDVPGHPDWKLSGMDYPPPSELDKWLQLYQRNGGSLRHLDPDMRRLILQRGAMKAQGGNPFSTDALDKQKQIRDYLNNDQKVRELLIRQKKMKA